MLSFIKNPAAAAALVALPLLFACNVQEIRSEAPKVNEVTDGSEFCIILPEDHTTGYTWQLDQNYDMAMIEDKGAAWHGNEKGVYYNFKAQQPGQTTLRFVNRKYTDTLNVKSFIIKILAD